MEAGKRTPRELGYSSRPCSRGLGGRRWWGERSCRLMEDKEGARLTEGAGLAKEGGASGAAELESSRAQ